MTNEPLVWILVVVAGLAQITAVVCYVILLRRFRRKGVGVWPLLLSGLRSLDPASYDARGQRVFRCMNWAKLVFIAAVLGIVVVAALSGSFSGLDSGGTEPKLTP